MKKYRFHVKAAMLGTLLLTFPACEGLFDDIYDNPSEANPSTNGFGFVEVSPETHSGTLYVNSSDYTQWVYIDLHSLSVDSTRILNEAGEEVSLSDKGTLPQEWDFAIHRYDTKTNEGVVLETSAESMEEKKFRRETIPPTHREQRIRLPLTFQTCITERSDTHVLTTIPSFPNGSRAKVCLPLIPCRAKSMSSG